MKGSLLNGNLLNEGEKTSTGIYKVIFKRSMLYQRPIFTEYLKKKERDKKKCFNNIYTYAFWLKITGTNCTSFLQHLLSLYIYTHYPVNTKAIFLTQLLIVMYYTALRGLARTSRHSYSLQTKITNPIEGEEGNSAFCIDVIKNIA